MNEHKSGEHMQPEEGALPQATMSAGEQLAAARQSRGWSIEDVAAQLNLAPRQVLAIETGNHAALPGMPITRGFIRSYAKLLRIDAAPLLATLGGDTSAPAQAAEPRKVVSAPFAESRLPTLGEKKRSSLPVILAVGAIVLAAAGYWALQNRDLSGLIPATGGSPSSESVQAPAVTSEVPAPAPTAVQSSTPTSPEPVVPPAAESAPLPATPAPGSSSGTTPAAQGASVPPVAESPVAPAAQPQMQAQASVSAPAPAADGLQLNAREETWVEIRRTAGDGVVFSRLMKPGESQTVAVTEPLSVVIGNASGIDLTLRGAPLPIKGGSGNVSKITVK